MKKWLQRWGEKRQKNKQELKEKLALLDEEMKQLGYDVKLCPGMGIYSFHVK